MKRFKKGEVLYVPGKLICVIVVKDGGGSVVETDEGDFARNRLFRNPGDADKAKQKRNR